MCSCYVYCGDTEGTEMTGVDISAVGMGRSNESGWRHVLNIWLDGDDDDYYYLLLGQKAHKIHTQFNTIDKV